MRVLLVGAPGGRVALRAELDTAGLEVIAEFDTIGAARASGLGADAIVVAGPGSGTSMRARATDEFHEALTPREVEVLQQLAEGLPNRAIATRLRVGDQTVKFHVSSILGKLGAANRTEAVRLAVRRGLITF